MNKMYLIVPKTLDFLLNENRHTVSSANRFSRRNLDIDHLPNLIVADYVSGVARLKHLCVEYIKIFTQGHPDIKITDFCINFETNETDENGEFHTYHKSSKSMTIKE